MYTKESLSFVSKNNPLLFAAIEFQRLLEEQKETDQTIESESLEIELRRYIETLEADLTHSADQTYKEVFANLRDKFGAYF